MTFLADRVTNVPVSFRQLRMKDAEGALQEGVVGATDLKIVQRAAGANQSVDFSVGAGYIQIDSGTRSGLAHFYNDAVANVAVPASNATNPRIDQAIVRYNDTSIPAGTGGNTPTPEILPGTATAGATLDNRTGAAALPNDCLRLADILVPATSTSVVTANIRDRRPWARGYFWAGRSPAAGGDVAISTTASTPLAEFVRRVEFSGANSTLLVTLTCSFTEGAAASAINEGLAVDTGTTPVAGFGGFFTASAASANAHFSAQWELTSADMSGSHLLYPVFKTLSGTATLLRATSGGTPRMSIMEIIRPNTDNGTT